MPSDTNRSMNRRRFLRTSALATAPVIAGCTGQQGDGDGDGGATPTATASPVPTTVPGPTEVTIGFIPSMAHAPLQKPSYTAGFDDANIEPTYRPVRGSSRIISFLSAGDLDVGGAAAGAAAHNGFNRGLPIQVVAPLHSFPPDPDAPGPDPFIVSEISGITEFSQLEGETLGVNTPGSAITWVNDLALRMGGLTIRDVSLRTMPFPDMIPAMDNEAIAGGIMPEPLATVAADRIGVRRLAENIRPGALLTVTSFNTEWAEDNPDAANAFMVEFLRGVRDLEGHWNADRNVAMIADYMEIPEGLVAAAGKPYISPNLDINEQSLADLEQFLLDLDQLDYDQLLTFEDKADTSFRDHALDVLGEA